jgi:MFS family permease
MPVLVLLCTAQFMVVLDVTIVAVALPAIRHGLGADPATLQWVVTAYTVAFGGLLVPAGRAADRVGRKRLFAAGLALFTGASLACGLAGSIGVLIAARAVQGAGAALVAPAALALLSVAFPAGPERGRAVAAWTAAAAGGGASGWLLGGLIADGAGWAWVFGANVPVGLAALLASARLLVESRDATGGPLDLPGGLLGTGALALLVLGLAREDVRALAAAALVGTAFVAVERRAPRPLVAPALLRSPRFAGAGASALVLTAVTSPAMLLAVLYQGETLGRSALATGLGCAPFNLAVIAGSLGGPRVLAVVGERRTIAAGLIAVAAGALGLAAAVHARGDVGALIPGFVVMGAGLGVASVAATAAGTAAAARAPGAASGVLNAGAQVGTALGFAALLAVADAHGPALADVLAGGLALAAAAVLVRKLTPPWMTTRSRSSTVRSPRTSATATPPPRPRSTPAPAPGRPSPRRLPG